MTAGVLAVMASCAPQTVQPPKPARVALVLGAGASRGFAHIGVLKVLETHGVPVHMIVGTSAGSFVGSLSAYGYSAFQIQKTALAIEKDEIIDLAVPDNGFVKGERLEAFVNRMLGNTPIERMKTPLFIVAASVPSGRETVFGRGNTGTAVRSSCAIPGVFRPVRIQDATYVDGGVVSPVAVDAALQQGADIVIAVDITADRDTQPPQGTIDTILQSIGIMYSRLSAVQLARADIVIRPKVGHIGSSDFSKRHEAILEGEKAASEALPAIRALLASRGVEISQR